MIQCRLRELMAIKGRGERRRVTYDDLFVGTGIAKSTLTRLASGRAGMVSMSVMARLCDYFNCQPGDLFVYVSESANA